MAVALAVIFTASAHAAEYKMVGCAGNSGAPPYLIGNNTASPQNPGGIFNFENFCGGAGGDPPGEAAFMRLSEDQAGGNAGEGASVIVIFDTPAYLHFRAAGAYTREPNAFNEGWRTRFWFVYPDGTTQQQFVQGAGLPNSGGFYAPTSTFAPHLWPWSYGIDFIRWVFELECVRPSGCDRSNYNAVDLNDLVFVISDDSPSQVAFTDTESNLMQGRWVRGTQNFDFNVSDQGSGLRDEALRVDGAQRWAWDHAPECSPGISSSQVNGEWARTYSPCPVGGPWARSVPIDTATLADGSHSVQACTQDYAQFQGLNGTGGETCDQRTIHTDNSAPGAPSGLRVTSDNPQRYVDHFGASFSLPPNQGSPITKVHYEITDAAGNVVVPEKVVSATNPTELSGIEGPVAPGAYQLRLWLEDEVGWVGPAASAPIPHDTTPPAAPQDLSVTAPTMPRSTQGFDVRWRNIPDGGSPITTAHYQVLNSAGAVVVPTQSVAGSNPAAVQNLEGPRERGDYTLVLWLSDAEGNVGAPVKAPLSYDCVRSEVGGGSTLSAGLGNKAAGSVLVRDDQGSTLSGSLKGAGQLSNAPLCVFSKVVTDQERKFLGIAMTGNGGDYQFAIGAGPSREITAVYRPDQRELAADAMLRTRVRPTFKLQKKVVHNRGFAVFTGSIPGPENEKVVVVLQVKDGKSWRVFRAYRTRAGGHFNMRYRFTQTTTPTTYIMRAQVRDQSGYPYEGGSSRSLPLRVLP